ncbi:MAG: MFS transporter [Candidatus Omnitrophota bacterium]
MTEKPLSTEKNLRLSFWDGVFASAMTGFTQDYFAPFLLFLGATVKQIGMLNAFPNLAAALMQLVSADVVEKARSRKKIITFFVFLQALILIPIALLASTGKATPQLYIALVLVFTVCGAFAAPAWGSLMSDIVAENKRGAYFGWRNRTLGLVSIAGAFCAGFILHLMKKVDIVSGFVIIFSLACIVRLISWLFLRWMYEPPLHYKEEHCFSFYQFLARIRESNFAQFVVFVALMSFSVNLASPFFAVLMLKDLHFSYLLYSLITLSATLTIFAMMGRWGRHADKVGNLKVIKFTAPLIGVIPLLWVINRHPLYLIGAQIFSGFLWAGFNLCATNFIYDAVIPEKRTRCLAYFNVLNGSALCAGALLGGYLIQVLPPLLGNKILALLLFSSILRLSVGLAIPRRLKEVRPVEKVKASELFFSVIGVKPLIERESK